MIVTAALFSSYTDAPLAELSLLPTLNRKHVASVLQAVLWGTLPTGRASNLNSYLVLAEKNFSTKVGIKLGLQLKIILNINSSTNLPLLIDKSFGLQNVLF